MSIGLTTVYNTIGDAWTFGLYSSLYRRTQRLTLQLALSVGGYFALSDIHSSNPSELWHWLCHRW